jgi:preprotein translocase subunit SecG
MMFASINWLEISINLLWFVFVCVCSLMMLIILMQRPKQEGLGAAFGANVTDQVFGARTTNVLQRGTVYMGTMFFVLAMTLTVLVGMRNNHVSLISKEKLAAEKSAELPKPAPVEEKKAPEGEKPLVPAGDKAAVPTPEKPVVPAPAPVENKVPVPTPPPSTAPVTAPAPEAPAPAPPVAPAPKPADDAAPDSDKKPSP